MNAKDFAGFAVPVGVDTGRDHDRDLDHAFVLSHFHRERVGGHEGVGAGVQRAGAERLDLRVEVLGHHADL